MYKLFMLFMIYSICGWTMEVIFKLVQNRRLVNRGFLIGPMCPIYGFCGLSISLVFDRIKDINYLTVFLISIIICAVFEYFVSWLLETLFNARWWDYSHKRFNLNGRICLRNLLFFGFVGCLGVYVFNPFIFSLLDKIPYNYLKMISIILLLLFLTDTIFSVKLVTSLKNFFYNAKKDSTEEITKRIRKLLIEKSVYFRRVIVAYPNFRFSPIKKIKDSIGKYTRKKNKM